MKKKIIIGFFGVLFLISFSSKSTVQDHLEEIRDLTNARIATFMDDRQFSADFLAELDNLNAISDAKKINDFYKTLCLDAPVMMPKSQLEIEQRKQDLQTFLQTNWTISNENIKSFETIIQRIDDCHKDCMGYISFMLLYFLKGDWEGLVEDKDLQATTPNKLRYWPHISKTYTDTVQSRVEFLLSSYQYTANISREFYSILLLVDESSAKHTFHNIFLKFFKEFLSHSQNRIFVPYFEMLEGYSLGITDQFPNPDLVCLQEQMQEFEQEELRRVKIQTEIEETQAHLKRLEESKKSREDVVKKKGILSVAQPLSEKASLIKRKGALEDTLKALETSLKALEFLKAHQADLDETIRKTKIFLEAEPTSKEVIAIEPVLDEAVKKTKKRNKKKKKAAIDALDYADDEDVTMIETFEKAVVIEAKTDAAPTAEVAPLTRSLSSEAEQLEIQAELAKAEDLHRQDRKAKAKVKKAVEPQVVNPAEEVAPAKQNSPLHARRAQYVDQFWHPTTRQMAWDDFLSFIKEVPGFAKIETPTGSMVRFVFEKDGGSRKFIVHKPHYPYDSLGISTINRVKKLLEEKLGITHP